MSQPAVQMLAPDSWRYNELANGGLGWQSLVRSTMEGLVCVGFVVGVPAPSPPPSTRWFMRFRADGGGVSRGV